MRLDFNVLWIDDQQHAIQAQRERLELLLRRHGFRLQVQFAASVEDAQKYLTDDVYTDHVDLILIDYDLGAGVKGDEGLKEIRNHLPHREIVFYSAGAGDLWDKVASAKVEGVYCSTRADLPDKAEGVFETLVKKVIDIDHARGIVMGTTSDIDHFVNDCLIAAFEASDDQTKDKALELVKKRMAEIRERFEKDAEVIENAQHVSDVIARYAVYTSSDRLMLLRKLLAEKGLHADKHDGLKRYAVDTIPKRNILAHVRVKVEGFKRTLLRKDGTELTSEEMKQLRIELLDHHELFEELYELLVRRDQPH